MWHLRCHLVGHQCPSGCVRLIYTECINMWLKRHTACFDLSKIRLVWSWTRKSIVPTRWQIPSQNSDRMYIPIGSPDKFLTLQTWCLNSKLIVTYLSIKHSLNIIMYSIRHFTSTLVVTSHKVNACSVFGRGLSAISAYLSC